MNVIDSFKATLSLVKSTVENLDLKNKIIDFLSYISKNIMGLFNSNVEYRRPVVESTIYNSYSLNNGSPGYNILHAGMLDIYNGKKQDPVMDDAVNKSSDYKGEDDYLIGEDEDVIYDTIDGFSSKVNVPAYGEIESDNVPNKGKIESDNVPNKGKEEPIYATINKKNKKTLLIN